MLSLYSIFYLFHDVCFAASLLVLKCIQRVIQYRISGFLRKIA